jgi:hypothetical protein
MVFKKRQETKKMDFDDYIVLVIAGLSVIVSTAAVIFVVFEMI